MALVGFIGLFIAIFVLIITFSYDKKKENENPTAKRENKKEESIRWTPFNRYIDKIQGWGTILFETNYILYIVPAMFFLIAGAWKWVKKVVDLKKKAANTVSKQVANQSQEEDQEKVEEE